MRLPHRVRRNRSASAEIPGRKDKINLPILHKVNGPPVGKARAGNAVVAADVTAAAAAADVPAEEDEDGVRHL